MSNEVLIRKMLIQIGDNPNRVGLRETPKRISKMWNEIFVGYNEDKSPNITTFPNGEDGITYNEMIIDEGKFYSHCEHHGVPFFGEYYFAYIPAKNGKILGLSKVGRVVDFKAAKLQTQERLVREIVDTLWNALCKNEINEPRGMALVMIGTHLCKSMRGLRKEGKMTTIELRGLFKKDIGTRNEFLNFVNKK